MSGGVGDEGAGGSAEAAPRSGRSRRKLVLVALPVILSLGAGAWFLLGEMHRHHQASAALAQRPAAPALASYVETPEMIVNLDAGPHRVSFAKVQCKLEAPSVQDAAGVSRDMPRIVDMLQTYLRATRPEELRSAVGTYRLREAFLARASIATPNARINDVLFEELIVQ